MKKTLQTWLFIQQSLQQNIEVMLLYVLESKGSSPGRQGFMMAVNAVGEMSGSMGGGIMEHKFVEMAKERLKLEGVSHEEATIKKQVHSKSAKRDQSGMICSGEQTIFLYTIQQKDIRYIDNLISSLQQNKNGTFELSQDGISFSTAIPAQNFYFKLQNEFDFLYQEKTGYKNHLHIIGAGHCSLALSQIMSTMDFYIHLYDDRQELNTFEQNDFVHAKTIVEDYTKLSEIISSGANIYVVVMTVGYRTDKVVVETLAGRQFGYFGLLGSRTKIATLFKEFEAEGLSDEVLKNIYAPIGLPIKSQTTEEIAVSIAAEIIHVKNQFL
ncbi:XdhC family protein [Ferruginibacter lapsinanis]|uniref:XdhC family protein n=1 Tax=Ferruginibacter lapsinanis TaxID=563172 RepID=UPI001E41EEB4|nr:XdhC family protein [Ferruginibacter lapsinanis]UEG49814.1 XdhC family protein [Ferruginibacter lapsinanis]